MINIGDKIEQKSGEILEVIGRTKDLTNHSMFIVRSLKYGNEFNVYGDSLIKKFAINPKQQEFDYLGKEYKQKTGEIVKVIDVFYKPKNYFFKLQSLTYGNIYIGRKDHTLKGGVVNPKEDEFTFVGKIFRQNCGCDLYVKQKTNIKDPQSQAFLFECEFLNPYYKVLIRKDRILKGQVDNKNLPWRDKTSLIKYLRKNFKEKVSINILHEHFSKKYNYNSIDRLLREYQIRENFCIDGELKKSREEELLKNYIQSIYKGPIETFNGKKEDHYYEIDIYLPELKIGFEYNGSFWHQEGKEFGREIGYHQKKFSYFLSKGILIFTIWDYFWFLNLNNRFLPREEAKQYIKNIIDIFSTKYLS